MNVTQGAIEIIPIIPITLSLQHPCKVKYISIKMISLVW